jgi:hypothetical protein
MLLNRRAPRIPKRSGVEAPRKEDGRRPAVGRTPSGRFWECTDRRPIVVHKGLAQIMQNCLARMQSRPGVERLTPCGA